MYVLLCKLKNILLFLVIFFISGNLYGQDANKYFRKYLDGEKLIFKEAKVDGKITLDNIIVMPRLGENGSLILEFNRNDISESFINDVFYSNEKISHTFTNNGFQLILTNNEFILKVHPGVIFYLRNDMGPSNDYLTFKNPNVIGKIKEVVGDVLYSSDTILIKNQLKDFYLKYMGPRIVRENYGSKYSEIEPIDLNTITEDQLLPKYFEPVVLEK